ncbi:unnamed protein product [Arabidopsis halleri]
MTNVTKLTDFNFLMWSRQVHAILDGHGLAGYVDGSIVAPQPTITTDGTTTVNREFTKWKRQDKLIYGALLGAISVNVQPILSTVDTSAAAWEKLVDTYAKPSRTHILQLRQQIKHWKKGSMSISEYVRGFTTRFDRWRYSVLPTLSKTRLTLFLRVSRMNLGRCRTRLQVVSELHRSRSFTRS